MFQAVIKLMRIYLNKPNQETVVSDYVCTYFAEGKFTVYHHQKSIGTYDARLGDIFVVHRDEKTDVVDVERVDIPDTFAGKVGFCLSFEEKKICKSYKEFTQRMEEVKKTYKSKKFVSKTDEKSYAFLVAKKPDRRFYAPLLLWVSEDISSVSLTLMLEHFKKYRKIYHPKDFVDIILDKPDRPLI